MNKIKCINQSNLFLSTITLKKQKGCYGITHNNKNNKSNQKENRKQRLS